MSDQDFIGQKAVCAVPRRVGLPARFFASSVNAVKCGLLQSATWLVFLQLAAGPLGSARGEHDPACVRFGAIGLVTGSREGARSHRREDERTSENPYGFYDHKSDLDPDMAREKVAAAIRRARFRFGKTNVRFRVGFPKNVPREHEFWVYVAPVRVYPGHTEGFITWPFKKEWQEGVVFAVSIDPRVIPGSELEKERHDLHEVAHDLMAWRIQARATNKTSDERGEFQRKVDELGPQLGSWVGLRLVNCWRESDNDDWANHNETCEDKDERENEILAVVKEHLGK